LSLKQDQAKDRQDRESTKEQIAVSISSALSISPVSKAPQEARDPIAH